MLGLVRSTLPLMVLIAAPVYAASNSLVVVIGSGPLAGTYSAPAGEIICIREKPPSYANPGYAVTWRLFKGYGPKVLGQAAVEVLNPEKYGGKYGTVTIAFGDPENNPTEYNVTSEPLTFSPSVGGFTLAFDGKTKEGIRIHVTASCSMLTEM